jgi:hypothetical protein
MGGDLPPSRVTQGRAICIKFIPTFRGFLPFNKNFTLWAIQRILGGNRTYFYGFRKKDLKNSYSCCGKVKVGFKGSVPATTIVQCGS